MVISEEYDIAIVGAGPAGCSAANFLSEDYKILLIDLNKVPRNKPCGGILVEESVDFIHKMKPPKEIFSSPKELPLSILDWDNEISIKQKRALTNVNRKKFDWWLLENAMKKVDFSPNTKLLDFEEKKTTVDVLIERNGKKTKISADYLIAADGATSVIRGKLYRKYPKIYPCIQHWIKPKKNIQTIYFIFDRMVTDYYSWIIPKDNLLIIGSAIDDKKNVKAKFDTIRKKIEITLKIVGSLIKEEGAIGTKPESEKDIFLGTKHVLMAGEAAGLISPTAGDGISFALRSGYNASMSLNKNFDDAAKTYIDNSQELVSELKEKIEKAKLFSDPTVRMSILKKIEK